MSHVTSRASQCEVTIFLKMVLTNKDHIVLATFGVRFDSCFALDV